MIKGLYDFCSHWSAHGSVWLYSDPHFDDEEMSQVIPGWIGSQEQIDSINKYAFKNDYLVFLGDIGNPEWLRKLKCQNLIAVLGNHDRGVSYYSDYFESVYDGPLFISDRILLSHEPIDDTPFCFNFHGHTHCQGNKDDKHMNLCADVIGYKPISLGAVIKSGALSKIPKIHRLAIERQRYEKTSSY